MKSKPPIEPLKVKSSSASSASQGLTASFLNHPLVVTNFVLLAMLTFGTVGYMLIEKWPLLDSLYMTVITMTTIGFGEVRPLSSQGRGFTIVLIMVGVVIASYTISAAIELFTSQDFLKQFRERRRRREVRTVEQHCIICGFGRMGRSLAHELQARNAGMIVIDLSEVLIEECHQKNIPALQGNAADERILREAGIERANALVAATKSDAENVFVVLTARSINPRLRIIARANLETSIPKLERAGADTVISPYAITGRRIAHMLMHPNVTQFLDGVLEFGDHQMRLEEFTIGSSSPLAGLTLRQARLRAVVLAVDHPDQLVVTHPTAETQLMPGTSIIVMGLDEELNKLEELVKG